MSRYELCKFTPAPDPDLICGICIDVLDTPYETPCHHVFCRECILKAIKEKKKCPVCRACCREKQCKKVLPLVQNLINKLTMRCDNFDNGCTDLIPKEFFLDHVKSCGYAMVQCRFKNCGQYLLKRDCENHELNTCPYRDRLCENGCGLMIPVENINSHNCMEALVALVKDLKEKNLDLQKRVDQLQQAPVSIAKSESVFVPRGNQRDDNWIGFSTGYDDTSSLDSDNDSLSSSSSHLAWRRPVFHSQSVGHSDESDLSDTDDIQGNDNSDDVENADRSLENGETNDGHNADETPGNQVVDEIVNAGDNCHSQSANSAIDSSVVSLEVSSLATSESCESPSVLDYSSSMMSQETTTGCSSANTDKRQHEDDSVFCDDNTGRTQSKRIKLSHSQQHINTQNEEATLASTSLFASNTSNIQFPEGVKKHPYGHKTSDEGCHSAVDVSGGLGLSVADEVAIPLPLTSNTEISQNCHTSSSGSANTVNSRSKIINNENNLRCGPVTQSHGQDLHTELEDNAIPRYAQEDDDDDESWLLMQEN